MMAEVDLSNLPAIIRRMAMATVSDNYEVYVRMLTDPQHTFSPDEDEDTAVRAALALVCGDIVAYRRQNKGEQV